MQHASEAEAEQDGGEDADAANARLCDRVERLQALLDAQVDENDLLSSEVSVLRQATTSEGDDVAAAAQVAAAVTANSEIEELQAELKKDASAIKTEAKLLIKEKDELAAAFEMVRSSNSELETSLEELVNLLETERGEFKIIRRSTGV